MTSVAFTPAPEELIACARASRVFSDGLMVKVVPSTVSVKLEDGLIEVLDGSATVGRFGIAYRGGRGTGANHIQVIGAARNGG